MTEPTDYPYLQALMAGWFHQDCFVEGATDSQIVTAFVQTMDPASLERIDQEIDGFLMDHAGGLAASFTACFDPDVSIGETDAQTRDWLLWLKQALREEVGR